MTLNGVIALILRFSPISISLLVKFAGLIFYRAAWNADAV